MFWELAPEDVIGKCAELRCANVEREWKRRKHKMEKALEKVLDRKMNTAQELCI